MAERPTREAPMEVVNLGLCRTGTQSFCDALEQLGYGTLFHMKVVMGSGRIQFWTDAINALMDGEHSKVPTAADLDRETSAYRGCADAPIAMFVDALLDAYPDATLVLTKRDPEAWMRSMNTSILKILFSNDFAGPEMQTFGQALARLWGGDFEKNGHEYFLAHNQRVRDEVEKRGRKILEIDVSKPDDFQRLCTWLGKTPPADMVAFPHSDVFKTFKRMHGIGGYEKDESAAGEWNERMTSIKG